MPDAIRIPSLRLTELDGSPDIQGVERIYLTSGYLSSLGNGEALLSLSGSAGGSALTVQEIDGAPLVSNVNTIQVTNGTLTDNGGGNVTIAVGGGAPTTATYITQTPDATLSNEQALSTLASGYAFVTTGTGVVSTVTLASDKVTLTSGNLSTASTTFIDATSMSVTITTSARRCLVIVSAVGSVNTAGNIALDIDIDGSLQGGAYGLMHSKSNNDAQNVSFSYLTAVLTAASHTFKLQWRVDAQTGTLTADTNTPLILSVIELPN